MNAIISLALLASAALALPWDLQGFSHFHYNPKPNAPYPYSYPSLTLSTPTAGVYPTVPVGTGTGTGVVAPTGIFPTSYPTAPGPVPTGYGWKRGLEGRQYPYGYAPFPTGTGFGTGTGYPAPTASGGSAPGYGSFPPFDYPGKQYGGPRGHGHQPFYPISYGPAPPPSYPTSIVTAPTAPVPTGTAPVPTGY